MSLHGKRRLTATILDFDLYQTLDEYGDSATSYNDGWTLNVNTIVGEFSVSVSPKHIGLAKPYLGRWCLYMPGLALDFTPPLPVEWDYQGDALPKE